MTILRFNVITSLKTDKFLPLICKCATIPFNHDSILLCILYRQFNATTVG